MLLTGRHKLVVAQPSPTLMEYLGELNDALNYALCPPLPLLRPTSPTPPPHLCHSWQVSKLVGGASSSAGGATERRRPSPLPSHLISKFGREVLEALLALHCLGLPCPHLHAGNVLLDTAPDGTPTCMLTE